MSVQGWMFHSQRHRGSWLAMVHLAPGPQSHSSLQHQGSPQVPGSELSTELKQVNYLNFDSKIKNRNIFAFAYLYIYYLIMNNLLLLT